jgi:hypothetical protein
VSVFGAPFGGEDADCYEGVPRLLRAVGTSRLIRPTVLLSSSNTLSRGKSSGGTIRGDYVPPLALAAVPTEALSAASNNLAFIIGRLTPMPLKDFMRAGEELAAGLRAIVSRRGDDVVTTEPPV